MTLPEWVESVTGLVSKLSAVPIKISQRMLDASVYLTVSFSVPIVDLISEGLAQPLRELANSKLQRIKSIDIADAAIASSRRSARSARPEAGGPPWSATPSHVPPSHRD